MESGIYYFNPTAEMAVANGVFSYQPPELLQTLEKEMAAIMLYFAGKNDVVLVHKHPGERFLKNIRSVKPDLPEFMTLNELITSGRKFEELVPWGWSPVVYKTLESVFPLLNDNFKHSSFYAWNEQHKTYYNRLTASKVLQSIYSENIPSLADYSAVKPHQCFNADEVQELLNQKGSLVIKAPFSSSGRGLQMLRRHNLNNSNVAWINSILEKQEYVMTEKLHNKVADLSFHFRFEPNSEPEFLGIVYFDTNSNGQFKGCHLQNHPKPEINKLADLFIANNGIEILKSTLKKYFNNYEGFMGIDAMIIEESGKYVLHPCVEINPRFTMGLLTLYLRKTIKENGYWQMLFNKSGNRDKNFREGTVWLTPVGPTTKFAAVLHIHK